MAAERAQLAREIASNRNQPEIRRRTRTRDYRYGIALTVWIRETRCATATIRQTRFSNRGRRKPRLL